MSRVLGLVYNLLAVAFFVLAVGTSVFEKDYSQATMFGVFTIVMILWERAEADQ